MKNRVIIGISVFILVVSAVYILYYRPHQPLPPAPSPAPPRPDRYRTFADIVESGELRMLTRNNAHCYYMYRDQNLGVEYELAKSFADYIGVGLVEAISETWEGQIPDLSCGKDDFIIAGMTITPEREKSCLFNRIPFRAVAHHHPPGQQNHKKAAGFKRQNRSYLKRRGLQGFTGSAEK